MSLYKISSIQQQSLKIKIAQFKTADLFQKKLENVIRQKTKSVT